MFISIKRYLDNRPEQVANALLRMARLLLQGIELHAVKGDAADYERFRADVRNVASNLSERPSASEVLVLAGATVKALEEYNSRTSRFIQLQTAELQTMVAMLTKTMSSLASGSEGAATRLQDIERQLHKASLIEEFQTAKIRMSECLETLRTEIERQRQESARHVAELNKAIRESQERTGPLALRPASTDPVTGLPLRAEAEAALSVAAGEGRRAYAVVFAIERIELINSRFGHAVGDQLLLFFGQHLAQGLGADDRLFRWSGPALLAILERDGALPHVRDEVSKIASKRIAKTVRVGTRSVLLPVAASWTAFSVLETRSVSLLLQHIDSFVRGAAAARASA